MSNPEETDSECESDSRNKPNPMSLAIEWVARITAVALLMVVPGFLGQWIDSLFGSGYMALIGFGLGFVTGFAALLAMVKPKQR